MKESRTKFNAKRAEKKENIYGDALILWFLVSELAPNHFSSIERKKDEEEEDDGDDDDAIKVSLCFSSLIVLWS